MPTATIGSGHLTKFRFKDETTFGVAPSGNWIEGYFYQNTLAEKQPFEDDDVIGGVKHNSRDSREPAPGLSTTQGQLSLPLCLNAIGDALKLILGAPSTSGATNFTHVFASGAAQLPTRSIEQMISANDFRQFLGCAAKTMKIDAKDDKGVQRIVFDLLAQREVLLTSTAAGAPTTRVYDPMARTKADVYLNSVQLGLCTDFSLEYGTGVDVERYIDGNAYPSAMILAGLATLGGSFKVRYSGQTLDNLAIGAADQALELRFVKSGNNSLVIAMPAARLSRAGAPINGAGALEQEFMFRCSQTSVAAMMTATLKNQIASY